MEKISVLFSGGPDSTLSVLYALEKAEQVHLLTYHHKWMGKIGKHTTVIEELKDKFGEKRIAAKEVKIDDLFNKIYLGNIRKYLLKYRTFYIPWICGACKMTMHLKTIEYNRIHKIGTTYDGAHKESSGLFPAQMTTYIDVMKEHYSSIGMNYECPVYSVEGTDKETEKYGMISTKDTKKEHVYFSTQHTCYVGLLIHAHARLYYKPVRGKDRTKKLAGEFLKIKLNDEITGGI